MKKILSIALTFVLILILCACDLTVDTSEVLAKQQEAMNKPMEMTLVTTFGPESGAEFEMILGDCFQVLSCRALNEAGETLLDGIRVTDRLHYMLMQNVLMRAQELEWLGSDAEIKVTADSENGRIWTVATKDFLSKPFDCYKEETGIRFSYTVELPKYAPEPLELDQYEAREWAGEGRHGINYVNASNYPVKDITTNEDGSVSERYYFANGTESIELHIGPTEASVQYVKEIDKSRPGEAYHITSMTKMFADANDAFVEHRYMTESNLTGYTVTELYWKNINFIDGTVVEQTRDDDGNLVTVGPDCTSIETFDENGNLIKRVEQYPDGTYSECAFNEFGEQLTSKFKNTEGYLEEHIYENGRSKIYRKYTEDESYDYYGEMEWLDEKSGIIHVKERNGDSVKEYDTEFTTE